PPSLPTPTYIRQPRKQVQTRACRVERKCYDGVLWGPPLRVIAPVFDFINHGGRRLANARYGVEDGGMCDLRGARLVVRANRDIARGEETLLDDDASIDEYGLDDDDGEDEVEVVEVGGGTGGGGSGLITLAPSVARAIAERATETAFNLILEPEAASSEEDWDAPEFVRAMSLAASLRWSQHRVLLAFAQNLKALTSPPPSASSSTTKG
ncbi:hypothetical protein ACHAW5_009949, partial [Stephanodiscus triporus]